MSELTKCNFCSLQTFREDAAQIGERIVLRPSHSKLKGINAYSLPLGMRLPRRIEDTTEEGEGDLFHQTYWCGWFMALTDHCVC